MTLNRFETFEFSQAERHALCQHYLDIVYKDSHGHTMRRYDTTVDVSETYGEILYPSVIRLLSELNLTEQDVFYDLGSGLGKVVAQVFLLSLVKEAHGIEILTSLHEQAVQTAARIQCDLPEFFSGDRKLQFTLGSFLQVPLTTATVVLLASPCFSPVILHPLEKIIADAPNIDTVLSLQPIHRLHRLKLEKTILLECSWDSALCYIYRTD